MQRRVSQYLQHMCFAEEEAHIQSWCLKAFTDLALQIPDGTHGRGWRRQYGWEGARCPLKQRDRTDWASALPSLPFSWDSSCVLGFNVPQGCASKQSTETHGEQGKSAKVTALAQELSCTTSIPPFSSASYHDSL